MKKFCEKNNLKVLTKEESGKIKGGKWIQLGGLRKNTYPDGKPVWDYTVL